MREAKMRTSVLVLFDYVLFLFLLISDCTAHIELGSACARLDHIRAQSFPELFSENTPAGGEPRVRIRDETTRRDETRLVSLGSRSAWKDLMEGASTRSEHIETKRKETKRVDQQCAHPLIRQKR